MTTAYLDMANWIDLAEGNTRAQEFECAVYDERVEPVLSFTHLLELANQEEAGWRRVSNYINFIRRIGKADGRLSIPVRCRGDRIPMTDDEFEEAIDAADRGLAESGLSVHQRPFKVFEILAPDYHGVVFGLSDAEAATYGLIQAR